MSSEDADWSEEEEGEEVEELQAQTGFELGFTRAKSYEILSSHDIVKRQKEAIDRVCDLSGATMAQAGALLLKYNWNMQVVMQKIVDTNCFDMTQFRRSLSFADEDRSGRCPLCYSEVPGKKLRGLECRHLFCVDCYTDYLKDSVQTGVDCIFATCPQASCPMVVPEQLFKSLLSPALYNKYKRFMVNSYIERGSHVKWCPAPGCEFACEYIKDRARDVTCSCGFAWCFKCGNEAHSPLDCETLTKWMAKNASSDDSQWIKANTKICPKCKSAIQKNDGCMHMTCRCGHQFCWLCLGDWNEHGSSTGGYYQCNKFQKARLEGKYRAEERERFLAEQSVKRYEHYYNRYMEHKKSYHQAITKNKKTREAITGFDVGAGRFPMQFLEAALDLLVECRNVIANSYAYGYYITSPAKLQFFEFLQGDLEFLLEKLDGSTDADFNNYIETEPTVHLNDKYFQWKEEVNGLVNLISSHFEKTMKEILAGFPDVRDLAGHSEEETIDAMLLSYSRDEALKMHWTCGMCTYSNLPADAECKICSTPRPTLGQ